MSEMSFEVLTDLTPVTETRIDTNFAAVKAWLEEELAPYATMVVTPDAISDAKKTRANIRKVGESIDAQRKAIKKQWLQPYEEYEAKCKELTGIVNNAVGNIDGQIKAMENEVKEQKRQELEMFFTENSADIAGYISFDEVFDLRMLNSTYSKEDAEKNILWQLDQVRNDLTAIRGLESPYETAMLSEYAKSHNLGKALAEGKRLEAIQKAEEERKAREVADTFAEEETPAEETTAPKMPIQPPPIQFIRPMDEPEPPKPKLYTIRFEVTGTAEAFSALKRCMTANNMEYEKI